jgi:mono/diheme cytochrome c family protein
MKWLVVLAVALAACASGAEPVGKTGAEPVAKSPEPSKEKAAQPAPAATADIAAAGQQVYARNCLTCHQADGYGVPNMQPAITDGDWVKGDARALALFVMTGGFNSAERKDGASHNVMPAFRQLPDEELAALLTYIRQKFGKGASPVSADDVAAARATLPAN